MNLLSTGNQWTEVSLDSYRTSLIIGTNGSGKSTVLDAIMFSLYNRPFRKVNKGQLINSVTGKGLMVEIEFTKGETCWKVRRGSKPNIFEIYKNKELVNQSADNTDYQAYLENIIGMNHKAFSQVVILGAASFVPFMQLSTPERRKVIEDLLDIQVFSDMQQLLLKRDRELYKILQSATTAKSLAETKLQMNVEFNKKQTTANEVLIKDKETKIDEIQAAALDVIEKLEIEQKAAKDIKSEHSVDVLNKDKRHSEDELAVLKSTIKSNESKVLFLTKHDSCPTCKQLIDAKFKNEEIEHANHEITDLAQRGKQHAQRIETLTTQINEIFEHNKRKQHHEALIVEYEREIAWYHKQVLTLSSEIAELKKTKDLIELKPFRAALASAEKELKSLIGRQAVHGVVGNLLKDTGIKSVIIRKYIPVLNKLINQYLASFDMFVDFQINEIFEETIKSRHKDDFSYESFSEGEKSRIDLALLLAWRDVARLRNSVATNLLILDEVFDGSLDGAGVDCLSSLMGMFQHTNLVVISHKENYMDRFERTIRFQKKVGFSRMEII